MNELRIYMRQKQLLNIYGVAVTVVGTNPANLSYQTGTLSDQTWVDYTDSCVGLDKITFTFTTQQGTDGTVSAGEFVPTKGVSGTLTFDTAAYDFIKSLLVKDMACALNQIEVQILDTACGQYYQGYVIKYTQISWCEINTTCNYDITLTQADTQIQCIQQTVISDNWRGEFQTVPVAGKKHPRFSYCVEARPNGMLTVGWYLLGITSFVFVTIFSILGVITGIINIVLDAINGVLSIFGLSNPIPLLPDITDIGSLIDSYLQQFVESAGCGREHPAPLIRDYIANVCDKCGIQYNPTTIPIFFAASLTLSKSDGTTETFDNPYYNACYYTPLLARGIRRFRGINVFGGLDPNDTDFYIQDNAPLLALDQFLDLIKGVFNAQWRLESGFLYFERKDWFTNASALYNMEAGSPDRAKLVDGICYEWSSVKSPASCKGLYSDDPADKLAHEAATQYNSIVSFQQTVNNPNFDGILDKSIQIGATKFNCDGASTCYYFDAAQVLLDGSFLGVATTVQMQGVFIGHPPNNSNFRGLNFYGNYAVLMEGETCALPKIIIWDGIDYMGAKAVRSYGAHENLQLPMPAPNPYYPLQVAVLDSNNDPVLDSNGYPLYNTYSAVWDDVNAHPPQTAVLGSEGTPATLPPGKYQLHDKVGSEITSADAFLVNYPMYFEQHYLGTLWDIFHWIDDPIRNPKLHLNWNFKIALCCPDLTLLQIWGDSSSTQLLQHVLLDNGPINDGQITEINVCYDSGDNLGPGKYIEIVGIV